MRPGSVAGTVSMSPNCARSEDIFGEMPNCETTVSRSMRQIRMWRAARGCAEPAVRLESSVKQPRKIWPENSPIQCRTPSECPPTVPAMWRDGRTPKAVGASTNERKIMPPIQTVRERNMRTRRMDIGRQFSVLSSQFSVLSSQFSVLSSQFSVLSSQGDAQERVWVDDSFCKLEFRIIFVRQRRRAGAKIPGVRFLFCVRKRGIPRRRSECNLQLKIDHKALGTKN